MLIDEFLRTALGLVVNGRWDELREYFSLVREILRQPQTYSIRFTAGAPQDKVRS